MPTEGAERPLTRPPSSKGLGSEGTFWPRFCWIYPGQVVTHTPRRREKLGSQTCLCTHPLGLGGLRQLLTCS